MATANRYSRTGGLDASLQFELNNGENTGPGHATILGFYANYLTSRSSMADLIAAGTYASVRACGGPVIPLRLGRVDAFSAGAPGVPQPGDSIGTFRQQFDRMGFSPAEMIQVTACGHSLGSVHSAEFPQLVPVSTSANGQISFDSSVAAFDSRVVTEYMNGSTSNPLVVGPAVALKKHSDFRVFNSDGNATVNAMVLPGTFQSICQTVLQKMIDVVPSGVVLTDPIVPYAVKPVDMQLTLTTGNRLLLTGNIRIRTTNLAAKSIDNIVLAWKDRSGGNNCGPITSCSTTSTFQGVAHGFDDTFGFFPISVHVPASEGISSFVVKLNRKDGGSQIYDNNGQGYPMPDGIILQKPQSCLLQGSGALTAAALVRNDLANLPVDLNVSFLVPRAKGGNPVPALNNANISMTRGNCAGAYTFYTATFAIPGGLSYNARIGVTAGVGVSSVTDDFNHAGGLGGTCEAFTAGSACSSMTASSTASSEISSPTFISGPAVPSSSVVSSSSISSIPLPTPAKKPMVGEYRLVGCWTEGVGVRALGGAAFASDSMTLELCMKTCTGFDYWGTEYGRECYCANDLHGSSQKADETGCNMSCAGEATEYCGAGARIELYSTTATRSTSTVPNATGTLARRPTVGLYALVGCQTEATASRALSGFSYADDAMTLESCAAFCGGSTFFGTEYGRECFCGNTLGAGSSPTAQSDCSMTCAGNAFEYCGAGNRLELYRLTSPSSPTSLSRKARLPPASEYTSGLLSVTAFSLTLTAGYMLFRWLNSRGRE